LKIDKFAGSKNLPLPPKDTVPFKDLLFEVDIFWARVIHPRERFWLQRL
jgi:hypothetical protein